VAGPNDRFIADQSEIERALSDRTTRVELAPTTRLAHVQLTPEEGFLLSRIERPGPVSELLLVSGLPEERALVILLSCLTKGAIILSKSAAVAQARSPGAPPVARTSTPPPVSPARPSNPYGNFVFGLRELNEDIDLDTDLKKRILFLFANLNRLSHYRMLGVPASATSAEIRKAFLERSKEFHPDTYFRKRLGSYLDRIEAIFRRIREANDVLTDDARRAKYDREGKQFDPEEISIISRRQIEELEEEARGRVRKDRLMHARGFSRLTKSREAMTSGDEALAKGDIKSALQNYQHALELDPRLEEAKEKMLEARRIATAQRADAAMEQAKRAEAEGNFTSAATLLQSAMEVDMNNPRVHAALAGVKLRGGMDLKEARAHARRAMDLGDRSGRLRLLMGEILLGLGEKKLAKVELKAALEMGEKRAKELL
jgi:curved DNA-binding protein CbpA